MRRWQVFALAALSTAAAGTVVLLSREETLVERAWPVLSVEGWVTDSYGWLPTGELVAKHTDRSIQRIVLRRNGRNSMSPAPVPDFLSHLGPSITGLSDSVMSDRWFLMPRYPGKTLREEIHSLLPPSNVPGKRPGDRWLLVLGEGSGQPPKLLITTLIPSRQDRWIRLDLPPHSPLRGIRSGNAPPRVASRGSTGSYAVRWPAPSPKLVGILPSRTALLTTWRPGQTHDVDFFEVSLEKSGPALRTFTIPISGGRRVDELDVSLDCGRVALRIYTRSHESPVSALLEGIGLLGGVRAPFRNEIWVTDLNGRRWRKIGSLKTRAHGVGTARAIPSEVRWLPDGRQLSFMHEGRLYLADAPAEN